MRNHLTRRQVLGAASTGLLAAKAARPAAATDKPALLGGGAGGFRGEQTRGSGA